MVQDAEVECDVNPRRFDDLIEEQTPGGLNEQVRLLSLRGLFSFGGRRRRDDEGTLIHRFRGIFLINCPVSVYSPAPPPPHSPL